MTDKDIEQDIQAAGKTAPRVTPADIEENIVSEHYFTAADGLKGFLRERDYSEVEQIMLEHGGSPLHLLTFCVLVLRNGFTVTGESACASPENFSAIIGKAVARANAVQKIWPLMGYELKQRLSQK